ncbi:MAG: endonuclease NucS domain-containing protein [Candidatus Hodarchaeota archaeon]
MVPEVELIPEEFNKLTNNRKLEKDLIKNNEPLRGRILYILGVKSIDLDFIEEGLMIVNLKHKCNLREMDLLALDKNDSIVIIELKKDKAQHKTVGQVQAYMIEMQEKYPHKRVRGVIFAKGFTAGFTYSLKGSNCLIEFKELSRYSLESTMVTLIWDIHILKWKRKIFGIH